MMKTIYVGNLPYSASEDEVRNLFARYGIVKSIKLISDRETGKFRGFAFVRMELNQAEQAIQAFNGTTFGGRKLRVSEARMQAN